MHTQGLQDHTNKWLMAGTPMPETPGPDQTAYLIAQREAVDAMIHQVCGWVHICVWGGGGEGGEGSVPVAHACLPHHILQH